jgi:hypothetical protein
MSARGFAWLLLVALAAQLAAPCPALAALRNPYLPVVPALPPVGQDRCHFSFAYGMGSDITSYGPAMGCQWGRGPAFLLDWALAPADLKDGDEAPRLGGLGHLALGLKVDLLAPPPPSGLAMGWSIQAKALGSAAAFEGRQFAPQFGGQVGTLFSLSHPLVWGASLSWGAFTDLVLLGGDLNSQVPSATSLDLVDVGLSLAFNRQGRPSSLLGTVGAVLDASEGTWIASWMSLGVLF